MSDLGGRLRRFRALPGMLAHAPASLRVLSGAVLIALGLVITLQPVTSLALLAVYAGVSCILSGLAEIGRSGPTTWWRPIVGALWIAGGIALIVWLGVSIAVLPVVLSALLILGGVSDVPRVRRGPLSARVLVAAWIVAQIAIGVLALVWPDLTSVTIAVLFGIRMVVFGAGFVWRGLRGPAAHADAGAARVAPGLVAGARWVAAALVIAVPALAWWGSLQLRAGLPVIDSFYSAPAQVPATPGALLRAEPWPGAAPEGAHVERILYTTTDVHGAPAVASAIVVIPDKAPATPARAILWDHGTTGIARACAPSLLPNMFEIQGIPAVADAISAGWVIVATDYSGQGAAGDFPYLVGEGEARSTLDSLRAAKQLEGVRLGDDAVVWGHSQGGHAALWTGAVARAYAPELRILGVAAISPAADPRGMAELIVDSAHQSPLTTIAVAWVLIPYSQAYADVDFTAEVAPAGRAVVREMSARCTSQPGLLVSVLSALGIGAGDRLYIGDPTAGAMGTRLDENKTIGPWPMPLMIAWGGADEVISPTLQHRYVGDLCAAGIPLTWREYPGYSHMSIVASGSDFLPTLVSWTSDRFAGRPAPAPTC